ncbi:MAG: spermidine synthase, partial [Thermoanaerobaculia bacterium]
VLMALEILGSRVLAPSYGSSVYVWGSLISTFLAALAIGYALGGRLADRHPSLAILSVILSIAAVLIVPCVVWGGALLRLAVASHWDARWSALFSAIVLFLPASVAMGMVTPFAVRIAIREREAAGSVAGGYSALSTVGSILGTLLTTFLLIPAFPVNSLLLGLAATLVLCAVLLMSGRASVAIVCLAAAACTMAGFAGRNVQSNERVLLRKDTAYHHIVVTQLDETRWLRFDNLTQSAVNVAHPERAVLPHEQGLPLAFAMRPRIQSVCMIGLGGGGIPRILARIRPDVLVESVEIDPAVRDLARELFLYRESEHTRTVIEDGRSFLARGGAPYDLIILDAFNSTGVPFHLTTREFFQTVRSRLSPDGVFAANFIANLMGKDGRLFWAAYQTIRRQFGQVYLINDDVAAGRTSVSGNVLVFATVSADPLALDLVRRNAEEMAKKWKISEPSGFLPFLIHSPSPPQGTPELTDAFAPVEALQHF